MKEMGVNDEIRIMVEGYEGGFDDPLGFGVTHVVPLEQLERLKWGDGRYREAEYQKDINRPFWVEDNKIGKIAVVVILRPNHL